MHAYEKIARESKKSIFTRNQFKRNDSTQLNRSICTTSQWFVFHNIIGIDYKEGSISKHPLSGTDKRQLIVGEMIRGFEVQIYRNGTRRSMFGSNELVLVL